MFFPLSSITVLNAASLSLFITAAVFPWVVYYDYPRYTGEIQNINPYPASINTKPNIVTNAQINVGLLFVQATGANQAVKQLSPGTINVGDSIPTSWQIQQCYKESATSVYCAPPVFPPSGFTYDTSSKLTGTFSPCTKQNVADSIVTSTAATNVFCSQISQQMLVCDASTAVGAPCLPSGSQSVLASITTTGTPPATTQVIAPSLFTTAYWAFLPSANSPSLITDKDQGNHISKYNELLAAASLFIIAFILLVWNFMVTLVGLLTSKEINLKLVFAVQFLSSICALIAMIIAGNYFQAQITLRTNESSLAAGWSCGIVGVIVCWFTLFVQYMHQFHSHVWGIFTFLACFGQVLVPGIVEKPNTAQLSSTVASTATV